MQDQQSLGAVYELLSRVLVREVDDELIGLLAQDRACTVLEKAAPGFGDYVAGFDDDAKEAADEEYCALFVLPGGVAPRAAAWMDGELETVGARISQLSQHTLHALGRDIAPGPWGKVPLDHVSLLLHLAAAGGAADELIAPWAPSFGRALAARAKSPLYKATGEVLCAL